MSTHWDVHCLDCNEDLGLHENHAERAMASLVAAAPGLANFASWTAIGNVSVRGEAFGDYSTIDLSFFVKHLGHRLIPQDEYGGFPEDCGKVFTCDGCSIRHTCHLPPGHEGACARVRP